MRRLPPLLLLWLVAPAAGDKPADAVAWLPGFDNTTWPFRVYSGLLDVPGPINGYEALKVHYQFHTSRRVPRADPVVTWHQGGPGGSSITVGLYGEMGAFVVGDHGNYLNPWAWNRVANMLYLESPAGSGGSSGYSMCLSGGQPVTCRWNDTSQAEAYAHTLRAFFAAFPEFAANDFYLAGESYFGQYGPNIAQFILNTEPFASALNLKGILLGNACWGGNGTCVVCNGPSEDRLDVDLYFGHGMYSPKLHREIYQSCTFPTEYTDCSDPSADWPAGHDTLSAKCKSLLTEMRKQAGPFNVYFLYDNCPQTQAFLQRIGKDTSWLVRFLRRGVHDPHAMDKALRAMNGGYRWDCLGHTGEWITRPDVRKALHLESYSPGSSDFKYTLSGPASITLYPELVGKLRVLIYNGQADACVPYNGNEQWISMLEERGILEEVRAWEPWFTTHNRTAAGYVTRYKPASAEKDFVFQTVRLAGHMVPQFQPEAGFTMFSRFLADGKADPRRRSWQELLV